MDTIVSAVHGYTTSSDYASLIKFMKDQSALVSQHADNIIGALDGLDRQQHSLGYLLLLDALSKAPAAIADRQLVDVIRQFLTHCDQTQIQHAPDNFASICRKLKDKLITLDLPRMGIAPLTEALRKLQPNSEHLTPIHADLFQLCLLSKCYSAAEPIVSEDIYTVDPVKTGTTATDVLLYCYYGGMVCTGRKQYSRALELFLSGLTAPAVSSNAITIAIYKKYVLVSLIHTGACAPLPRYASSKSRNFEHDHKAYAELAKAYATHSMDKLQASVNQFTDAFTQDGNAGLAKLVVESLVPRNVQRLTQTYLTLSLQDIATHVGLPSPAAAEMVVLRMIQAGQIFAEVDPQVGLVRFLQDPQQFTSTATAHRINQQLLACMDIGTRLQAFHDEVSADKAYISKLTMGGRVAERPARNLDPMDELLMMPGFPG